MATIFIAPVAFNFTNKQKISKAFCFAFSEKINYNFCQANFEAIKGG